MVLKSQLAFLNKDPNLAKNVIFRVREVCFLEKLASLKEIMLL